MDYGSYSSSFVKSRSFVPRGVRAVSQPDIARKEHAPVRAPPSGEGEDTKMHTDYWLSCLGFQVALGQPDSPKTDVSLVFWSVTV
jgi:hypothetical protein